VCLAEQPTGADGPQRRLVGGAWRCCLWAAAQRERSGSSRQGCTCNGVKVPIPSIARFGRIAYPGRGEVTNHERLGRKSHGCPTAEAVAVGATGVASTPAGLNMKD
jgi:hypothetical protein